MQDAYLKSLVLVEANDMVDPQQRFMSMNVNNDMIQELIDMFEENGRINRSTIARTVGRAMNLSDRCTTPTLGRKEEYLNIRRFRFYLHVVESEATKYSPGKSFLISGFTDEIGEEDLDALDGRSMLYINQMIELRSALREDRRGDRSEHYSIAKMFVVHRSDKSARGHHNGRVTDILTLCSINESGELDLNDPESNDDLLASAIMFGRRGTRGASLSDMSRSNYLTRLINADRSGMAETKTWRDNEYGDADEGRGVRRYNSAADIYADTPELDRGNSFISYMRSRDVNMVDMMAFEYDRLIDLVDVKNPDYDDLVDNTEVVAISDNEDDITYASKEFYGKSNKMRSVAIMCQEIPAMMAECFLSSIHFSMDNEELTRDGRAMSSVDDWSMTVPIDGMEEMTDVFIRRFEDEIFNQVTSDHSRYMRLEIKCVLGGLVEIVMAYENNDEEEFRYPSFMSGILSNNTSFDNRETFAVANNYSRISKDFIERTVFGEADGDSDNVSAERLEKINNVFRD